MNKATPVVMKCPYCNEDHYESDAFCHSCGGYLYPMEAPWIIKITELATNKHNTLTYLSFTIAVLMPLAACFTLFLSGRYAAEAFYGSTFKALSIILLVVYLLFLPLWVFVLSRGIKCPACKKRIPNELFSHRNMSFCHYCGTRLKIGEEECSKRSKEERTVPIGDRCSICGEIIKPEHGYCPVCGANVGRPSDPNKHALLNVPPMLLSKNPLTGVLLAIYESFLTLGCILFCLNIFLNSNITRARDPKTIIFAGVGLYAIHLLFYLLSEMGIKRILKFNVQKKEFCCPGCRKVFADVPAQWSKKNYCPLCGITLNHYRILAHKPKRQNIKIAQRQNKRSKYK